MSSGHITISALINRDGTLKAIPPKDGSNAHPVFVTLEATAGGKIYIMKQGYFHKNGLELSAIVNQGFGKLLKIFADIYQDVRKANNQLY